ncbi:MULTISPECIES: hypothetical protein [unclassified Iodidimonas]|jgi:hypothetical protein|uniref:hypothetical protein n=1 Tax=unclassified Iodidimonas TaxID=2626145 RepID=UPI0024830615|nr:MULTISPECIES: hypothetical protein [unclassified Iodidimonas]
MPHDLHLSDYLDGYRFICRCPHCGLTWSVRPADLLQRPDLHGRMTLDELAAILPCRRARDHQGRIQERESAKTAKDLRITPIKSRPDHHFIAGMV